MPAPEATRRLLELAATRLGGVEQVAQKLGITQRVIELYLTGAKPLPDALFLRVVDLISEPAPQDPKSDR